MSVSLGSKLIMFSCQFDFVVLTPCLVVVHPRNWEARPRTWAGGSPPLVTSGCHGDNDTLLLPLSREGLAQWCGRWVGFPGGTGTWGHLLPGKGSGEGKSMPTCAVLLGPGSVTLSPGPASLPAPPNRGGTLAAWAALFLALPDAKIGLLTSEIRNGR